MSKIKHNLINDLFSQKIGYSRKEVLHGPQYGVDCAVIELPDDMVMVVASDPLSYIPQIGIEVSAYISLHLAANDIATTGLSPQFGQFVLNLPSAVSKSDLEHYWSCMSEFAQEIGLHITGGHTGWDAANNTTIAGGGTLFSIGEKEKLLLSSQAQVNDVLLMTKSAGIISTSILGMSFPNYVEWHLGLDVLNKLRENIWEISVLPESEIVRKINKESSQVHAMHDVTEGGVMGAIYEFATASDLGVKVFSEQIHVEQEIALTANLFDLDAREKWFVDIFFIVGYLLHLFRDSSRLYFRCFIYWLYIINQMFLIHGKPKIIYQKSWNISGFVGSIYTSAQIHRSSISD